MMATTHALFGTLLAVAVARVAPEFAPVALVAAVAGSVFPDLDLYAGHRRTLHYPVYYAVLALPAAAVALAFTTAASVAVALFLAGAAAHSLMDAFGGGLELKPWRGESDRAVYDHFRGRWVPPRRWIRYDGAPEDVLVAAVFGAPALATYDGPVQSFVVAVLLVSAGYALCRKRMAALVERLVPNVPPVVRTRLPERFRETDGLPGDAGGSGDGGSPAARGQRGD